MMHCHHKTSLLEPPVSHLLAHLHTIGRKAAQSTTVGYVLIIQLCEDVI